MPEPVVARALERDEVGHRAAGHDHPAGALGQPEARGEPARQVQLDLGRARAEPVAADARVEPRGEQLGRGAGHRAGAADVGEERGVAEVQRLLERQLAQVGDELVDRQRLLRHRQRERRAATSAGARSRVTGSSGSRSSSSVQSSSDAAPPKSRACSGLQARSVTGAGGCGTVAHPIGKLRGR